jgi:predicted phosphodiesterase
MNSHTRYEQMRTLREDGKTFTQIAQAVGYASADTARGVYHRYLRERGLVNALPDWVGKRDLFLQRYDGIPILEGDWLVLSDIHFPTTRWSLLDLALKFGVKHMKRGKRRVLLLGDVVNFDAVSTHPHVTKPFPLSAELDMAADFLQELLKAYDQIVYVMGNHEDRLLKALSGAIYDHHFTTLLTRGLKSTKLTAALTTKARIRSAGVLWHCTHQRNYSILKNRVAAELALKVQANVVSAHQHHVSVGRDKFNRYTTIDCGGLFDQRYMAYAERTDSTAPTMCNGFVFIRSGTGHLLTPYPSLTDWSLWQMEADADAAVADAAEDERDLHADETQKRV